MNEKSLERVIKDDVESFEENYLPLLEQNNVFYGAFSMLDILYLFNCKKILSSYETLLIKSYKNRKFDFGENFLVERKFANLAGRLVRKYSNVVDIHPIEILFLQGKHDKAIKTHTYNLNYPSYVLKADFRFHIPIDSSQQSRIEEILKSQNRLDEYQIQDSKFSYTKYGKAKKESKFSSSGFISSIVFAIILILYLILAIMIAQ